MELKNFFAQDDQGNLLGGATCYLYARGTENLAAGLQAANGTALANPFTADAKGLIQFAAPNGLYDLRVVKGPRDYRVRVQCVDVQESVADAEAAAGRAEVARDAAQLSAGVFADTAAGLAGTASGGYFSVPGASSTDYLVLYKNNSGSAQEVKRYPSTEEVLKPAWAGKRNGWPDTFFRRFDLKSQVFLGRDRWWWNGSGAGAFAGWSRVPNSVFSGYALRRASDMGTIPLNGPTIHLDEIGAVAGEKITLYALFVGDGAIVSAPARFDNGTDVGYVGNQLGAANASGGTSIAAMEVPQWLRHEHVVPAGAMRLSLYPYTLTAGKSFDMVAVWAFKGNNSQGLAWPSQQETAFVEHAVDSHELRIGEIESQTVGATAYAIDAYQEVSASSTTVSMDGSGFSALPRDLVFMGWGERYQPAGVTFNALRVKLISRTAGTSAKWRTLHCVVRTGANSAAAGAQVVAVGSIVVRERLDSLVDVTFLLKDPITGLTKTLSDADFSGGEYFVGVYGYTRSGAPAACGEPRGTMANSLLQSYYHTSTANAPQSGAWSATSAGSNARLAFQHLLLTSPAESMRYEPAQKFLSDLGGMSALPTPEMVMPPYIYGVQGRECNVYLDNLHLSDADDYLHDVASASNTGQQQSERWTWTPSAGLASGALTITAHDKRTGTLLVTKTAQQRAAASTAGSGTTKKVLVVGDSLVNAGTITQTLLDIAAADVMGVTLLGTQGAAPNRHEGRGGWTVNDYTTAGRTYYQFTVSGVITAPAINSTEYSHNGSVYRVQAVSLTGGAGTITCSVTSGGAPLANGTLTKSNGGAGDATIPFSASAAVPGNPFWIGGALNFAQYLSNNAIATPDWVLIGLGINDCFSQTDDTACSSLADTELAKLDSLIASIQAADANVRIGLMIPSPPSADQDSFGYNYATGQTRWRFKRNVLIWARQMISRYTGKEANRIYLVPSNTALDTVNNMNTAASGPVNSRSSVIIARQNNGVHPGTSGYQQIGDAVWAFLKCNT